MLWAVSWPGTVVPLGQREVSVFPPLYIVFILSCTNWLLALALYATDKYLTAVKISTFSNCLLFL